MKMADDKDQKTDVPVIFDEPKNDDEQVTREEGPTSLNFIPVAVSEELESGFHINGGKNGNKSTGKKGSTRKRSFEILSHIR